MFSYTYKLAVKNADKGIVTLTPTFGTYAKAFAPSIVLVLVSCVTIAILDRQDDELLKAADDNVDADQ